MERQPAISFCILFTNKKKENIKKRFLPFQKILVIKKKAKLIVSNQPKIKRAVKYSYAPTDGTTVTMTTY